MKFNPYPDPVVYVRYVCEFAIFWHGLLLVLMFTKEKEKGRKPALLLFIPVSSIAGWG